MGLEGPGFYRWLRLPETSSTLKPGRALATCWPISYKVSLTAPETPRGSEAPGAGTRVRGQVLEHRKLIALPRVGNDKGCRTSVPGPGTKTSNVHYHTTSPVLS